MTTGDSQYWAAKALWVRRKVLEMAIRANSGHISTAFSQAEIVVALYYGGVLRFDPQRPRWPGRDRFVMSKGQGGIGLYPVLADLGFFPTEELDNFAGPGSILGVHCDSHVPGIEVITGSLGHGLPIATGMALAAKLDHQAHFVFCLLGDGEMYEGSNWEAMFSASHHRLGHLVCIIDRNKQATIGDLEGEKPNDGPRQEPLAEKLRAFGFQTLRVDGHNFGEIMGACNTAKMSDIDDKPTMIVADTVKGRAATIMENGTFFPNHYRLVYGDDLLSVLRDLEVDPEDFRRLMGGRDLGY